MCRSTQASDASQARLVGGVIQLARSLGVPVVAEGIERPGQLTRMRELGAELAQGYFIGGPMDGAALVGHLAGTDVPSPRIALVS